MPLATMYNYCLLYLFTYYGRQPPRWRSMTLTSLYSCLCAASSNMEHAGCDEQSVAEMMMCDF